MLLWLTPAHSQAAGYPLLLKALYYHLLLITIPATSNPQAVPRAEISASPFQLTIESFLFHKQAGGSLCFTICPECYFCFSLWCCVTAPVTTPATVPITVLLLLLLAVQLLPLPLAVSCTHTCIPYPPALWRPESVGNLWDDTPNSCLLLDVHSGMAQWFLWRSVWPARLHFISNYASHASCDMHTYIQLGKQAVKSCGQLPGGGSSTLQVGFKACPRVDWELISPTL